MSKICTCIFIDIFTAPSASSPSWAELWLNRNIVNARGRNILGMLKDGWEQPVLPGAGKHRGHRKHQGWALPSDLRLFNLLFHKNSFKSPGVSSRQIPDSCPGCLFGRKLWHCLDFSVPQEPPSSPFFIFWHEIPRELILGNVAQPWEQGERHRTCPLVSPRGTGGTWCPLVPHPGHRDHRAARARCLLFQSWENWVLLVWILLQDWQQQGNNPMGLQQHIPFLQPLEKQGWDPPRKHSQGWDVIPDPQESIPRGRMWSQDAQGGKEGALSSLSPLSSCFQTQGSAFPPRNRDVLLQALRDEAGIWDWHGI